MDPWFAVTQLGLPEAWAALSLGMVITYLILMNTSWSRPSTHRKAFRAVTVLLALALILAFVSVRAVKETAQVPRPCIPCSACMCPDGSGEGCLCPDGCNPYCIDDDFSFPSGHAATIFAACTAAVILLRRRESFLLYLPAALIAYSRIALGVHTPADIAAGSVIGIVSAVVAWRVQPKLGILS